MKKKLFLSALALSFGALTFLSSCSKEDDGNKNCGAGITQGSTTDRKIKDLISKIPATKLTRTARFGNPDGTLDNGWSFANPDNGTDFSNGGSSASYSDGRATLYVAANSFGSNSGGGTVQAGSTTLDVNYTFCFTTDDDAFGLSLFNGLSFTGVSAVIGVSGDFDQLQNASSDSTNFSDIFHGLAYYIVYDGKASGRYDILDWVDGLSDSTATHGNAFAFVFDFVNWKLYLSKSGTINVSGGEMDFDGTYLEVSGFLNNDGDVDVGGDAHLHYREVSGFGAMGCS